MKLSLVLIFRNSFVKADQTAQEEVKYKRCQHSLGEKLFFNKVLLKNAFTISQTQKSYLQKDLIPIYKASFWEERF